MSAAFKCARCGQTYQRRMAVCQLCGGDCAPVDPAELRLSTPPVEEPAPTPPVATCPCCDGARGPHTITQRTRHLKDVSFFPARRTYLVTTVKVPGVCAGCHASLERKRFLADVLTALPLLVLFGVLMVLDSKPAFAVVVIYLVYLIPRWNYTWIDFLLYGRELSWKLVNYVPAADATSSPSYPVNVGHSVLRIVFYPGLLALAVGFVSIFVPRKPDATAGRPKAEIATVRAETPAKAAPGPSLPPVDRARTLLSAAARFAVPVNSDTVSHPKLGRPAVRYDLFDGRKVKLVMAYANESKVPINTSYQLMTGATLLANYSTVVSDNLVIVDHAIILSPAEVATLAAEIPAPRDPPSDVKIRYGR